MMTEHGGLSLLFNIKEDRMQALVGLLNQLSDNMYDSDLIPYRKLTTIHLSRWVILEKTENAFGEPIPSHLYFETNYDGNEADHVNQLLDYASTGLVEILKHCEGFPEVENVSRDDLHAYIMRHWVKNEGLFIGAWGRSVEQIHQEKKLREDIENYLDENREELVKKSSLEIRNQIRDYFWETAPWSRKPMASRNLKQKFVYYGTIASLVLRGIILFPLILLTVIFFFVKLRLIELKEPLTSDKVDKSRVSMLENREAYNTQSQFSAVGNIKPGWFRFAFLKGSLWMINRVSRFVMNKGRLGTIPTIHFARWIFIDNNKRLLFISNVDGNSEQYLTDFINKQAGPMSAVFCHTQDFPKTRWLVLDGARDYRRFLTWSRMKQIPSQVWYSAYPDLTVKNINNNTAIRQGLYGSMTNREAQNWLNLL